MCVVPLLIAQLLIVGLTSLVTAAAVSAQADAPPLSLKRALVNVWPEYDDPRLLILYEGEFAAGETGFPQVVQFPVPPGPLQVNQAAGLTADAQYRRQQWEIINQPDGTGILSYTLPIPTFFFEYYVPGIEGQKERRIAYVYRTLYPVETLEFAIQVPLRSRGFRLSPVATTVTNDADGFTYHRLTYRNVQPGQEITLDVRYTKDNAQPSVQRQTPANPVATSPGRSLRSNIGYYLLALGAAGLVAAGGYYVWWQRKVVATDKKRMPASRRPRGRDKVIQIARKRETREPGQQMLPYCTQCGRALQPQDRFCPTCGTARRMG
ncbi:MAG: zinc ribbon domain-containing protein [Anaerolineae bacterium]|nr:zinc ribbon domain-containing protein [Anaerolineae bacterium]